MNGMEETADCVIPSSNQAPKQQCLDKSLLGFYRHVIYVVSQHDGSETKRCLTFCLSLLAGNLMC